MFTKEIIKKSLHKILEESISNINDLEYMEDYLNEVSECPAYPEDMSENEYDELLITAFLDRYVDDGLVQWFNDRAEWVRALTSKNDFFLEDVEDIAKEAYDELPKDANIDIKLEFALLAKEKGVLIGYNNEMAHCVPGLDIIGSQEYWILEDGTFLVANTTNYTLSYTINGKDVSYCIRVPIQYDEGFMPHNELPGFEE